MENPVYPGDTASAAILTSVGCHHTVSELKALLAGVLMGCSTVQPSVVLDHIELGPITEPRFADQGPVKEFLSVFFALWNEAANHRDAGRPFAFSQPRATLAANADIEGWLEFADLREREVAEFLMGLGLSDTPTLPDLRAMGDKETDHYLPNLIAIYLGKLQRENIKLKAQGKTVDVGSVARIIDTIDRHMRDHHRAFIEKMAEIEVVSPAPAQTIVRASPKTGRNDPCPCGSGKKFKQCCLQ